MAKVRLAQPIKNKITMAKLKNTDKDKAPESEVSNTQETTQEIDISPNTSTDAKANIPTDSATDTTSDIVSSDVDPKGTTVSDTGGEDASKPQIITPKQSEKEQLPTQKGSEKSDKTSPDSFTMEILKTYSNYESLYVNRLGCVYTLGTPEVIRGSAVLYKNPHFKPE